MIVTTITGTDNLSLEMVKKHLNVTFTDDDDMIKRYIKVSLNAVENYCRDDFITKEHHQSIEQLGGEIPQVLVTDMTRKPINQFIALEFLLGGNTVALPIEAKSFFSAGKDHYEFVNNAIHINLVHSLAMDDGSTAIIKWKTGFETEIEDSINHARLLLCGAYYENRESVVVGVTSNSLPNGIAFLLDPYMRPQVG